MDNKITLNRKFLKFPLIKQLWYNTFPVKSSNEGKRLGIRGVQEWKVDSLNREKRNEAIDIITTMSPKLAMEKLNQIDDLNINLADFSLNDLYAIKNFPFLKLTSLSALWIPLESDKPSSDPIKDIFKANEEDLIGKFDTKAKKYLGEVFLRWPFYIGGIIVLDTKIFPSIFNSEYFLSSRFLDYYESLPILLDLGIGIGIKRLSCKYEILKRLDPYKIPLPTIGYLAGRFAKKLAFSSFQSIGFALTIPFEIIYKYLVLRSFDYSSRKLENKVEKIERYFRSPALQITLLEHWLEKGHINKAQVLFNKIIEKYIDLVYTTKIRPNEPPLSHFRKYLLEWERDFLLSIYPDTQELNRNMLHLIECLGYEKFEKLAPGLQPEYLLIIYSILLKKNSYLNIKNKLFLNILMSTSPEERFLLLRELCPLSKTEEKDHMSYKKLPFLSEKKNKSALQEDMEKFIYGNIAIKPEDKRKVIGRLNQIAEIYPELERLADDAISLAMHYETESGTPDSRPTEFDVSSLESVTNYLIQITQELFAKPINAERLLTMNKNIGGIIERYSLNSDIIDLCGLLLTRISILAYLSKN